MIHKIKRQNLFNFLKAQGIVKEIQTSTKILELNCNSALKEMDVRKLNLSSNYWQLSTENKTFLEPSTKKVDGIIIEETAEEKLRIILVELKSKTIMDSDIIEKFEQSLSWVYLLLNLLNGKKEDKEIEIYGILASQIDKNWNEKSNLNIFNSTSIRYVKRSFYTTNGSIVIDYDELIKKI